MTTLYNCHTEGDAYRITKFDSLGNVESSYICTKSTCECPAGVRPSCRHRQMLPLFLSREAVDSYWFFDFDRKGWVMVDQPATEMVEEAETKDELTFEEELDEENEILFEETGSVPGPGPVPKPSDPTYLRRRL